MTNKSSDEAASVCYFLVCFSDADYVAFLLASLYRECDLFLVHCDSKAPTVLKQLIAALSDRYANVVIVPTQDYSWAGFSHVRVTLDAMTIALKQSQRWGHFIALSEQHLPLRSPAHIALALTEGRSMLVLRSVREMGGAENQDIGNRFAAVYRELPGVGCFAIDVADRQELLEKVHHGTNWFAICQSHCKFLIAALAEGELLQFETVLHPEETAIQTILAPLMKEIEPHDITLVALPHLTDNHSLVMTDDLFRRALPTKYLFIRKRPNVLSSYVCDVIKSNHFVEEVYGFLRNCILQEADINISQTSDSIFEDIIGFLAPMSRGLTVGRVSQNDHRSTPKLHLIIEHPQLLEKKLRLRILSENLQDYKVLIDRAQDYPVSFKIPFVRDGILFSTIRSRVYNLSGHEELLPLNITGHGFITSDQTIRDIKDMVERLLIVALSVGGTVPSPHTIGQVAQQGGESMSRSKRLNALAVLTGAKRYLEIGVCHGETFFEVDVPYKVAVDPNFRFDKTVRSAPSVIFHETTSDEFFARTSESKPFDLIYLDGLHTFEQTLRDFLNSFKLAHRNTVWLLDDTVPTNVFAALPSQHDCWELRKKVGIQDWSWMGDVYKVVFFVSRMMPMYHFRTYNGHGQTVLWRGQNARSIPADSRSPANEIGVMTYDTMVRFLEEMLITPDDEILNAVRCDLVDTGI